MECYVSTQRVADRSLKSMVSNNYLAKTLTLSLLD